MPNLQTYVFSNLDSDLVICQFTLHLHINLVIEYNWMYWKEYYLADCSRKLRNYN